METPEQLEGFPASCEAGAMMESGPLIPVHKARNKVVYRNRGCGVNDSGSPSSSRRTCAGYEASGQRPSSETSLGRREFALRLVDLARCKSSRPFRRQIAYPLRRYSRTKPQCHIQQVYWIEQARAGSVSFVRAPRSEIRRPAGERCHP
jgi:hypothetical protein